MAEAVTLRKFAALDTNILFHLAEQHAPSHNLVRVLVRRGYGPMVTQTVIHELALLHMAAPTERKKQIAHTALTTMREWGVQPGVLKPVGNGICDVVKERFFAENILPSTEVSDACILIEASFHRAEYLYTWDKHLLDADNKEVNRILGCYDLDPVRICHPAQALGYDC